MTRKGKIARLPRALREELNRRLDDGQPASRLIDWLNTQPDALRILQQEFAGRLISEQNLSGWKAGGYLDWLARKESKTEAKASVDELVKEGTELAEGTQGHLTDHLATMLAARYARVLANWHGESSAELSNELRTLRTLCHDLVWLRRGDHSYRRLDLQIQSHHAEKEKTAEEVVEQFKLWVEHPGVRDWICQTWLSPEEKERRLCELFKLPPKQPQPAPPITPSTSPAEAPKADGSESPGNPEPPQGQPS